MAKRSPGPVNPLLTLVVGACAVGLAAGYCVTPGKNPYFTGTPKAEQLGVDRVRITWYDIVGDLECVDHFLVKYWLKTDPNNYKVTGAVDAGTFEMEIPAIPNVYYHYQVVAREDKGSWGVDWNRSNTIEFKTSRSAENAIPTRPPGHKNRIGEGKGMRIRLKKKSG